MKGLTFLNLQHKPSNLVQTIERVSTIFDVMAKSAQGISVKELSAKVGLPKGTTHRLLTSLAYFGYVRQASENKNYFLGFKLVELGNRLLDHLDLRAQARPFLMGLCQKTKEACSRREGGYGRSNREIFRYPLGRDKPLTGTGNGHIPCGR